MRVPLAKLQRALLTCASATSLCVGGSGQSLDSENEKSRNVKSSPCRERKILNKIWQECSGDQDSLLLIACIEGLAMRSMKMTSAPQLEH